MYCAVFPNVATRNTARTAVPSAPFQMLKYYRPVRPDRSRLPVIIVDRLQGHHTGPRSLIRTTGSSATRPTALRTTSGLPRSRPDPRRSRPSRSARRARRRSPQGDVDRQMRRHSPVSLLFSVGGAAAPCPAAGRASESTPGSSGHRLLCPPFRPEPRPVPEPEEGRRRRCRRRRDLWCKQTHQITPS